MARKPKQTQTTKDSKVEAVALFKGLGQVNGQIATTLGITPRHVRRLEKEGQTNPDAIALRDMARKRINDKALALVEKHMVTVDESMTGVQVLVKDPDGGPPELKTVRPALKEQATALRELGTLAGMGARQEQAPWQPVAAASLTINLSDPEVVAGFVQALRLLNEPTSRVIDVTPTDGQNG